MMKDGGNTLQKVVIKPQVAVKGKEEGNVDLLASKVISKPIKQQELKQTMWIEVGIISEITNPGNCQQT